MRPRPANLQLVGYRTLGAMLALCITAGCQLALGGDASSGRIVGTGELDGQVGLRIEPGALRSPDGSPVAWLSVPTATITLTSSDEAPGTITLDVANTASNSQVSVRSIRGVGANDDPDCTRNNNEIDCAQSDDPLCDRGTYTAGTADTTGTLSIQLPTCRSFTLALTPPRFERDGFSPSVAVLGRTHAADAIPEAAGAAADDGADLLALLGDHTEESSDSPVDELRRAATELPVPVVALPGERERTDGSVVSFERAFGPVDLRWEIGEIDFVAPDASSGGLGREGISELQRQLRPLGQSDTLIAMLHRPPLDPDGFRDRGFTSRIEGARTISLLADFNTDAIAAGHLTTPTRDEFASIPLHVVDSADPSRLLVLDIPPDNAAISRHWINF